MNDSCGVFWGSHGCDLPPHEDGQHECDCHNADNHEDVAAHRNATAEDYGADGCAGTWPYYGRASMSGPDAPLPFFRMDPHRQLPDEFGRLERLVTT